MAATTATLPGRGRGVLGRGRAGKIFFLLRSQPTLKMGLFFPPRRERRTPVRHPRVPIPSNSGSLPSEKRQMEKVRRVSESQSPLTAGLFLLGAGGRRFKSCRPESQSPLTAGLFLLEYSMVGYSVVENSSQSPLTAGLFLLTYVSTLAVR